MSDILELDVVENPLLFKEGEGGGLVAETTSEEVIRSIHLLKDELRDRIVILGHHYQRDDIIQFADRMGDSFELSRFASELHDREFIIFCGVHFMAETADVLSAPHQKVILPDLKAGCSMSDMARVEQVLDVWDEIGGYIDTKKVCPITYMNSSAAIKAFCGEHGGAVSTEFQQSSDLSVGVRSGI